jgi:hypothetical protein
MDARTWLTFTVGIIVAAAWLANVAVQVATQGDYTTPLEVHGLMGAVVGALYADWRIEKGRK